MLPTNLLEEIQKNYLTAAFQMTPPRLFKSLCNWWHSRRKSWGDELNASSQPPVENSVSVSFAFSRECRAEINIGHVWHFFICAVKCMWASSNERISFSSGGRAGLPSLCFFDLPTTVPYCHHHLIRVGHSLSQTSWMHRCNPQLKIVWASALPSAVSVEQK